MLRAALGEKTTSLHSKSRWDLDSFRSKLQTLCLPKPLGGGD